MSKRRKQNRSQTSVSSLPSPALSQNSLAGLFDLLLLFLTGTLITARYFLPAESAAQGETLYLVLVWLLVAALFCITQLLDRSRSFQPDRFDAAVWLLVFGQVTAVLVMIFFYQGQQRAALNMLWEWVALGISFSLLRRLIAPPDLRFTFLLGILTTVVLLSIYGIWQHHWMYDQLAREYLAARQQLDAAVTPAARTEIQNRLISMGVPPSALEGSSRLLFEQRLLNSNEPLGMFALTNTFAGLLSVGFLLAFALTVENLLPRQEASTGQSGRFQTTVYLLSTMTIGYCLILTKSRSAWLGVLAGLFCLAILKLLQRQRFRKTKQLLSRKQLMTGVVLTIVLLLGFFLLATFSGGFDRAVLSEAPKSLQYRLEYWTATWAVIQENPLWGTGPGNFREHYLKHKLPGSSEEIADPHNLFLDVWANAGLIALAGLLLILGLACYYWFLKPALEKKDSSPPLNSQSEYNSLGASALLLGFVITFPLLWIVQLFLFGIDELALWLFCPGWLILFFLLKGGGQTNSDPAQKFSDYSLIPLSLAACFVALSVHLLIAGGIAMPAITQTWLLLLVLAFPVTRQQTPEAQQEQPNQAPDTPSTIHLKTAALFICVLLLIFFVITDFAPTMRRKSLVQKAEQALMRGQSIRMAQQLFSQASQVDPLSSAPWQALADIKFREAEQDRGAFEEGVAYKQSAIQRNPLNPLNYFDLGLRFYEQYQSSHRQEDLTEALKYLNRAVAGYPHNSRYRALLAEVYSSAEQYQQSRQQAEQALKLDQANRSAQHLDKYLDDETVARMKQIINDRQSNQN